MKISFTICAHCEYIWTRNLARTNKSGTWPSWTGPIIDT